MSAVLGNLYCKVVKDENVAKYFLLELTKLSNLANQYL